MAKILVVDDEASIVTMLAYNLKKEGYDVVTAEDGEVALEKFESEKPDLLLLDIMMPKMDGYEVCRKIREKSNVPIIMLTARADEVDKVVGLEMGADDYVTKPFGNRELIARVKAQLRRYMMLGGNVPKELTADTIEIGGVCLDDRAKKVTIDGEPVNLTKTEYAILKFLMEHPNTVYAPKDIYRAVWEDAPFGQEGTVAVHIRHLREKIEADPSEPRYIKVVWGQGYMFGKE